MIKTRTVRTLKAQPMLKSEPVPNTTIELWTPAPRYDTLQEQAAAFTGAAAELELTLRNSLPGGVYDRLLGAMLAHKSSHFIVSWGDFGQGGDDDQATYTIKVAKEHADRLVSNLGIELSGFGATLLDEDGNEIDY